jgi:hypothetical protein
MYTSKALDGLCFVATPVPGPQPPVSRSVHFLQTKFAIIAGHKGRPLVHDSTCGALQYLIKVLTGQDNQPAHESKLESGD